MKLNNYKLLFVAISIIASSFSFAQIEVIVCDTAGISSGSIPEFAPTNQVSKPPYANGWAFGTNYDPNNLIGVAQAYENLAPSQIVGLMALFGAKSKGVNNPNTTKATFTIHNMVSGGAYDVSPTTLTPVNGPGVPVLGTGIIQFEEIDTTLGTFNFIPLNQVVNVSGNFVIAADLEEMKLAGDTLGFLSDGPGNGLGLKYTFHKVRQGTDIFWATTLTLFQNALDLNVGIFAVMNCDTTIVEDPTGIIDLNDYSSMSGMKAVVYPNPAINNAMLAIEVSQSGNYSVEIYDLQGRKMNTTVLGFRNAGNYTESLDIEGLNAGNYIFSLINENGARFTKMFVKQ